MTPDPELLDIRQAAALLHVSAASLRRWTNAGLLASFRVGGRRERRFRRAAGAPRRLRRRAGVRARIRSRRGAALCGRHALPLRRAHALGRRNGAAAWPARRRLPPPRGARRRLKALL